MKSLYLIAALCGIWMSVDGAILECLIKMKDEKPGIFNNNPDLYHSIGQIFNQIDNIKHENLWESLDTEIRNICYPSKIEEKLYPLAMRIFKVCGNRDHPFTEKGKRIFENILKHSFCDGFVKLAAIAKFSLNDYKCFKDRSTMHGILKCSQGSINALGKFFSPNNSEMCTAQLETSVCINQLLKKKCKNHTLNLIESLLAGVRNIFRCAPDTNTTVVSNSSGISSVFQISKLDSESRDNTSRTESKETCKSKIENDKDIVRDISNLKHILMSGLKNITEIISKKNSAQSLDSMANDVCVPAINDDILYSLMTRVFKICLGQEDIFTEDGKQMFKSLVKPLFCNIPMKVAALGHLFIYDDCNADLEKSTSKCDIKAPTFSDPSPGFDFSEKNVMCRPLSSRTECYNEAMKTTCPASVSERMGSFWVEVLNFVSECDI